MTMIEHEIEEQEVSWSTIQKLSKDLRDAVGKMPDSAARVLVDFYDQIQEDRVRCAAIVRQADEAREPNELTSWLRDQFSTIEQQIKLALGHYALARRPGRWMMSQYGIGPVISAGLLAHINIDRAPTAGHIWRLAGLDPNVRWIGNEGAEDVIQQLGLKPKSKVTAEDIAKAAQMVNRKAENITSLILQEEGSEMTGKNLKAALARRPWNAKLKRLCWIIGCSFMKFSGRDECFYGKVYAQRKVQEIERNESRAFRGQAEESLRTKKITDKTLRERYEDGRLPDGRILLRAQRYAVKLFLSHLQHVMWESKHGTPPPKPYIIEHGGHVHYQPPVGWPCD